MVIPTATHTTNLGARHEHFLHQLPHRHPQHRWFHCSDSRHDYPHRMGNHLHRIPHHLRYHHPGNWTPHLPGRKGTHRFHRVRRSQGEEQGNRLKQASNRNAPAGNLCWCVSHTPQPRINKPCLPQPSPFG